MGEALAPFRDQVVIATKFGFDDRSRDAASRPAWTAGPSTSARWRRLAKRLRRRRDRSVLPAPRRPERADRGCGRRGQGPDRARARSSISACRSRARRPSAAPMRCSRSRRCRANIRCGGAGRKPRNPGGVRGTGHRLRALQPAGQGIPDRRDRRRTRSSTKATSAAALPRFTPEAMAKNQALVDLLEADRRAKRTPRRRRSRWPGCWRRSPGSCRSPAPPSCTGWKRISARRTSS